MKRVVWNFLLRLYSNSITPHSPSEDELPPDVEPPLEEEPVPDEEPPPLGVLLLPESTAELPEVEGAEDFWLSTSRL